MKIKYLCTAENPLGDIIYLINYQNLLEVKDSKVQIINSDIQCSYKLKKMDIKDNEEKIKLLI